MSLASNAPEFDEGLAIALELTIAGVAHAIPGGAVRGLELDLDLYGFRGFVEFDLEENVAQGGSSRDELLRDFTSQASCDVHLELAPVFVQAEAARRPTPLVLEGLASERSFVELQLRSRADQPILTRRYRLSFADPARVLWTQHFPCRLYTEKTLKDVIGDQLGDRITMTCDWSVAGVSQRQWFVHLPVERGVSFYDFLCGYVDGQGGQLVYDYTTRGYVLCGAKAAAAAPEKLFGDDIDTVELIVPPAPAHAPAVVNTYAESPSTTAIANEHGAAGVRHDLLLRSEIAQDTDERVALETTRLVWPEVEAALTFARTPVIGLYPGLLVELRASDRWSASSYLVDKIWRVQQLHLRVAIPVDPSPEEDPGAPGDPRGPSRRVKRPRGGLLRRAKRRFGQRRASDPRAPSGAGGPEGEVRRARSGYAITLSARLEQSTDPRRRLPAFRRPHYPGYVEGKVVSEKGEDGEKTYQRYRNEATSLDEYTVEVPAWSGQTVTAPFIPTLGSGNVYVPCYRDERVLLALDLHDARIARLLTWREGAALSMDVQGEQVLLGLSATSNTSLNHIYEDRKPVFNVARKSDADTQRIKLSEGCMLLEVREQEE